MRYTTSNSLQNTAVWLSPEEIKDPGKFIGDFCQQWQLSDCRYFLWKMLSGSISISYQDHDVIIPVGRQIHFFENLISMVEAVYMANKQPAQLSEKLGQEEEEGFFHSNPNTYKTDTLNGTSYSEVKEELDQFFQTYTPSQFSDKLIHVLEIYASDEYYRETCPADLVCFTDKLTDLIRAAHQIFVAEGCFSDTGNLMGSQRQSDSDLHSAVVSSINEQLEAINRVFKYRSLEEWELLVKEITFFTLSSDNPSELGCLEDTLLIYRMLCKLVDACWELFSSTN